MGVFEVARYCPVKPRKATIARRPFLISRSFMASNPGPLQRRMNKVNVMLCLLKGCASHVALRWTSAGWQNSQQAVWVCHWVKKLDSMTKLLHTKS